jgi:hypothetical protein
MSRSGPALRSEADGMWYFQEHPEVAEYFKQAGIFSYCEKLTTFHQQIAETFALSYDGRVAKIGREEFIIDEASIAEYAQDCLGQVVAGSKHLRLQTLSSDPICCRSIKL